MTGSVTSVIDGDTVQVRLSTGRSERVRLVGANPRTGARCVLVGAGDGRCLSPGGGEAGDAPACDATQDTRDR